jgi:hypothetical protein
MSGREREEFHLTCHSCFGEIHIDCKARPLCPRCGKTLEIEWRDPVETPRYANVTEGGGRSQSLATSPP